VAGRLYLCPTPIGNLADITLRALEVLGSVDGILCEDTRRTGRLLAHHKIPKPPLIPFHDRNEAAALPAALARLRAGETLALVSDAGTPLINDPGFKLVRACVEAGVAVEALPGPSALTVAVAVCGLPASSFCFLGFLPRGSRRAAAAIAAEPRTVVAFDSPRRVAATIGELAKVDPNRPVALCRELTKLHEEVLRGTAAELAAALAGRQLRGEVVVVVGPAERQGAAPAS